VLVDSVKAGHDTNRHSQTLLDHRRQNRQLLQVCPGQEFFVW
jgi:hypothetical protein